MVPESQTKDMEKVMKGMEEMSKWWHIRGKITGGKRGYNKSFH
jgi:hypothetical protein